MFEREDVTEACSLNWHATVLTGLRSFDILSRTNVFWSSSEAEDMEAVGHSIVEATSWMDWWTFTMKSLALQSSGDSPLINVMSCHLGYKLRTRHVRKLSVWWNILSHIKTRTYFIIFIKDFTIMFSVQIGLHWLHHVCINKAQRFAHYFLYINTAII